MRYERSTPYGYNQYKSQRLGPRLCLPFTISLFSQPVRKAFLLVALFVYYRRCSEDAYVKGTCSLLRSLEQTCKYKTIRISLATSCDLLQTFEQSFHSRPRRCRITNSPLERKVDELSRQIYVSYFTLQETIICTDNR